MDETHSRFNQAKLGLPRAKRESLGIPGLDKPLGGGLSLKSCLLLLGQSGAGKTHFSVQFLLEGMALGHRGIYLSYGPMPTQWEQKLPFRDRLDAFEKRYKFQTLWLGSGETGIDGLERLAQSWRNLESARIVIGTGLMADAMSPGELDALQRLQRRAQALGASVMVLGRAYGSDPGQLGPNQALAPAADVVLFLRSREEVPGVLKRELMILHMMGIQVQQALWPMKLGTEGLLATPSVDEPVRKADQVLIGLPPTLGFNDRRPAAQELRRVFRLAGANEPQARTLNYAEIVGELNAPSTDFALLPVYDSTIPFLARQGLIQPLDGPAKGLEAGWISAARRRAIVDDKVYAAPQHVSTRLLFWRKDALRELGEREPATWVETLRICRRFALARRGRGSTFAIDLSPESQLIALLERLWAEDEDLFEWQAGWRLPINAIARALEELRTLVRDPALASENSLSGGADRAHRELLSGRAAAGLAWSDLLHRAHESGPETLSQLDWRPLPDLGQRGGSMLGGLCWVVPARTRFADMAFKSLEVLMTPDVQANFDASWGWPFPALAALYQRPDVMKRRPYYARAELLTKEGRFLEEAGYMSGNAPRWSASASAALLPYLTDRSDQADPRQAAKALELRLASLLPVPDWPPLVAKALDLMQQHLGSGWTIARLARELDVTRSHLIRLFHTSTGTTPLKHLNAARMEKAQELLTHSRLNIGETGAQTGFKTMQHFSRAFKQATGMSPRDFRNRQKKQ